MKIDWANAPRGARWWAVDANGQANWFCVPEVVTATAWGVQPEWAPDFGFTGDWRSSLVERPPEVMRDDSIAKLFSPDNP